MMAYYISAPRRTNDVPTCTTSNERIQYSPMLTLCPPKWVTKAMAAMAFISVVVIVLYLFQPHQSEINVLLIDTNSPPLYETNERYLSLALDTSLIANNFEGFHMRNPKLIMMMLPLAGGYLRIGGTMADRLIFSPKKIMRNTHIMYEADGGSCAYEEVFCTLSNRPNFTLSGSAWIMLNSLAVLTNFTIIFDLNALRRTDDGSWDHTNAESLIQFSQRHGIDLHWELGNEPNRYRNVFDYEVSGVQLAKDFRKLRYILNKYPKYANSLVVGPDVTKPKYYHEEPRKFLLEFLLSLDTNVIDAISWHQYYFRGPGAHLSSFLNPDVFDLLQNEIWAIKSVTRQGAFSQLPLWLGETSSAYGGGSPAYSDKFAGTFIWLDKLGLAAKNGIDLIVRQSLFKGHYALLDENYDPNPDWWISVMYKKLVGRKVLDYQLMSNRRVRLYCHCAKQQNGYVNTPAIVVFGSNVNASPAYIRVDEINSEIGETLNIQEFLLTTQILVTSKEIYLNDELLVMETDGQLPKFKSRNLTSNIITIPQYSLGFWLIPVSKCNG